VAMTINKLIKDLTVVGDTEKLLMNVSENYSENKISKEILGEIEFKNVDFGYGKDGDGEQEFLSGSEKIPADVLQESSKKSENQKSENSENAQNILNSNLKNSENSENILEKEKVLNLKTDSKIQKNDILENAQNIENDSENILEKEKYSENDKKNKKEFSLKNINLKIEKGQKVAFVGESGGGKSTSIELVGGFYFPQKGEILVDNVSTKDLNLNSLRSSIAYVSQDIAIFNSTIGENISYGSLNKVSEKEIKKAAKLANISEFIENLPDGYKTKVGEKGLKLSGGQKQRIAIARAILRNPKILILDEPTSALDIVSEKHITEALKTLMIGRTTIIIAHRISTVADADKIFVFKKGQIVESGNYENLISKKGEF
jgi:ABC-type multidrug transport system fused ATPase/permease subunit